MLPAPPLTLTDCLIAADWCDDQGWSEYAGRLRAMAAEPPMRDGSPIKWYSRSRSASTNYDAWPHSESMAASGLKMQSVAVARRGRLRTSLNYTR